MSIQLGQAIVSGSNNQLIKLVILPGESKTLESTLELLSTTDLSSASIRSIHKYALASQIGNISAELIIKTDNDVSYLSQPLEITESNEGYYYLAHNESSFPDNFIQDVNPTPAGNYTVSFNYKNNSTTETTVLYVRRFRFINDLNDVELNINTDNDTNYVFLAYVEEAGDEWDVKIEFLTVEPLVNGATYILSFNAHDYGENGQLVAGIGLNEDPFTSISNVINMFNFNTTTNYLFDLTYPLSATGPSKVFFDIGATVGYKVISDVVLTLVSSPDTQLESSEIPVTESEKEVILTNIVSGITGITSDGSNDSNRSNNDQVIRIINGGLYFAKIIGGQLMAFEI